MSRINKLGRSVPDHLWQVTEQVHSILSCSPHELKRWQANVRTWCEQQRNGPRRTAGGYRPLPLVLEPIERFAVLAAIHDFAAEAGMEWIGPHDDANELTPAATAFAFLKVTVSEYSRDECRRLLDLAAEIADEPDGPVPPDAFRWLGALFRPLPPIPWRLVNALWTRDGVDVDCLGKPVWADAERELSERHKSSLNSAKSKANDFFRANGIPFQISLTGRHIRLKEVVLPASRKKSAKSARKKHT